MARRGIIFYGASLFPTMITLYASAFSKYSYSNTFRTHLFHSNDFLEEHKVQLEKPMGIILEEANEDTLTGGVIIKSINPNGATAAACRNNNADICVRDKILEINGVECANAKFEDVMEIISDAREEITFVIGRPSNATVVKWSNGISVAAMPGDYFGQIAQDEAFVKIPYSCSNGGCGTCEQSIFSDELGQRYIRPCVSRVPKGSRTIIVNPSDRYEPSS